MATTFEVPNLDGFASADELHELGNVFGLLAHYAWLKSAAMKYRAAGRIAAALQFEKGAEVSYKELPDWAKW